MCVCSRPVPACCVNQCVHKSTYALHTGALIMNEINYKNIVGEKVRALRKNAGLSQEVLAERCGIFRTYLSRIESGAANPSLVVLVTSSLSTSPSQRAKQKCRPAWTEFVPSAATASGPSPGATGRDLHHSLLLPDFPDTDRSLSLDLPQPDLCRRASGLA